MRKNIKDLFAVIICICPLLLEGTSAYAIISFFIVKKPLTGERIEYALSEQLVVLPVYAET